MAVPRILVTGGAGYIGSHACKALAAKGFEPVTVDNLSRGNRWAVKWGPLEETHLSDRTALNRIFARYQPKAVMHFAAFAYVGESVENPLLYYQNNVGGSAALVRAVIDAGTIPIVFSSTCAVYGIPESIPVTEDHRQHPINPYGFSKLVPERMLADADSAHGLRSVALRYFNAAGADPGGDIGEAHDPEPHLIPRVLAAGRDGTAVTIYGDDYDTGDGTCVRDYIHICDIADAHVRALDYLLSDGKSCAPNLANAQGYSVMDVIRTAERVCGKTVAVQRSPRRPGDAAVLVGSAARAKATLHWSPCRPRLDDQIADAWNWMQKRQEGSAVRAGKFPIRSVPD